MSVELETIGTCAGCGGDANHKMYKHPDRVTPVLIGLFCEDCTKKALELSQVSDAAGTVLAVSADKKGK